MKWLLVACLLINSIACAAAKPCKTQRNAVMCIPDMQLPQGTVGVPYSYRLVAYNDQLPETWSLISGELPTGISLSTDGVLQGTPTEAGTYSFTVKVQDSSGSTAYLHVIFHA